jgi:hypothetical protein
MDYDLEHVQSALPFYTPILQRTETQRTATIGRQTFLSEAIHRIVRRHLKDYTTHKNSRVAPFPGLLTMALVTVRDLLASLNHESK